MNLKNFNIKLILLFTFIVGAFLQPQYISMLFSIVFPIVLAILLAIVLRPVIVALSNILKFKNKDRNYKLAVVFVYLALLTTIILIIPSIFSIINYDIYDFWETINSLSFKETISDWLQKINPYLNATLFVENIYTSIANSFKLTSAELFEFGRNVGSIIFKILYTFAVSAYISLDFDSLSAKITQNYQNKYLMSKFENINLGLRAWIKGWVKDQSFVFTLTFFVFLVAGMKNSLVLAIVMTVFNFVPFIGPIIGATLLSAYILVTSVGETAGTIFWIFEVPSMTSALIAVFGIILVQMLENLWWIPRVYSSAVTVKPLVILVSLTIIATIFSPLAAPLTIPLIVIIKEFIPKRFL